MVDANLVALQSDNKNYRVIPISSNKYKIDMTVVCDGGAMESSIAVPFVHSLDKLEIKHVDSSLADSVDELSYSMYRNNPYNLFLLLYGFQNVIHADIMDEITGMINESSVYKIETNSTNTDILYISFYISFVGIPDIRIPDNTINNRGYAICAEWRP